jgi:hypothetical protein
MARNPEAEAFFEALSAQGDVASEFVAALAKLGQYEVRSAPRDDGAQYAVTSDVVFGGAAGMASTYWRLSPEDRVIALATGAAESEIGPEWVEVRLFRNGWPNPDLRHWALRAYGFARGRRVTGLRVGQDL